MTITACTSSPNSAYDMGSHEVLWGKAKQFVKERGLTFLKKEVLDVHGALLKSLEVSNVPGMVLEFGVAKGGSSLTFAALKRSDRCMHLFDTFKGMPPPSALDGQDVHNRYKIIQDGKAGDDYYGYYKDLLQFVKNQYIEFFGNDAKTTSSIRFHRGLFNDSLTDFPMTQNSIAYAHLDGDWYESVYSVLVAISPYVSIGGIIILDDAFHYSGAATAFEKFYGVSPHSFREKDKKFVEIKNSVTNNTMHFELIRENKMIARRFVPLPF